MRSAHNTKSAALLASAICLSVSVCALGQDAPAPPALAPSDAPSGPTLKSPAELIEEYKLPKITEGPALTFEEALKAADQHNPSLASMRTNIESAQAHVKAAWGGVLPVINGKMEYIVRDHPDTVNFADSLSGLGLALPPTPDMVITNRQDVKGSLVAVMPIFNFQNWVNIRVAEDAVALSKMSVEAVRQQLYLNVAEAYFSALMSRKLIDVQLTSLASLVHHLSVAQARFNAGAGLRIDVIRAQTDLESAKQQIISANLFYDNTRDALAMLTGINGLPMPSDEPTMNVPEGDDQKLEEDAIASRYDVKTAEATISVNRRALRASKSQFLPTIDAMWQGSYQFTKLGDLGSPDKSRMLALFTLTVPLYNHYRYGDLDGKRAELKKSEFDRENLVSQVSMSVRKARRDYEAALTSVDVASHSAALSKEALTLTQAAYNGGSGSSLDVTDATRNVLDADVNLSTKNLQAQLALLKFLYAIGKDLESIGK